LKIKTSISTLKNFIVSRNFCSGSAFFKLSSSLLLYCGPIASIGNYQQLFRNYSVIPENRN